MSNTQLTLNQTTLLGATTGTITCLLAPLSGKQLLLPNVTVAEVRPVADLTGSANSASGRVGEIKWRDSQIPVFAFEGVNGQTVPSSFERIVILTSISTQRDLPHYGIAVQGEPRVAKVKIAELEDLEGAAVGPVEFLQVRYAGELAVIPDLDAFEAKLLQA